MSKIPSMKRRRKTPIVSKEVLEFAERVSEEGETPEEKQWEEKVARGERRRKEKEAAEALGVSVRELREFQKLKKTKTEENTAKKIKKSISSDNDSTTIREKTELVEEKVLFRSRIHPKILFPPIILQIILILLGYAVLFVFPFTKNNTNILLTSLAILVAIDVYFVIIPILRWQNEIFTVTNKKVKNDWGVLYKNSREIQLDRIVSISEERGILDRIFGSGTLNFYDAAATQQPSLKNPLTAHDSHGGIRFHDVPNVKKVKALIEKLR